MAKAEEGGFTVKETPVPENVVLEDKRGINLEWPKIINNLQSAIIKLVLKISKVYILSITNIA